jgi:hypothetical protein
LTWVTLEIIEIHHVEEASAPVEAALEVEAVVDLVEEAEALAEEIEMVEEAKCMMLFVLNVERIVKYHSDLVEINLFFVAIVLARKAIAQDLAQVQLYNLEYLVNNSRDLKQSLIKLYLY